jgi:ribonuclease Z
MNAEHILLTHFSARYPKMPPSRARPPARVQDPDAPKEPVVALAFDNASLKIGDLWKVNYYIQAVERTIEDAFQEEGDEGEDVEVVPNPSMEVAVE